MTALAFIVLLVLGARDGFPWIKGSITATTLFSVVPLTDPLAALEVVLASGRLESTMLIGAGILVAVALLLGPVFCGWLCPLGLLLDLNDGIRRRLVKVLDRLGIPMPRFDVRRDSRYLVLGLALGFSLIAGLPAFQTISPINLMSWSLVFFSGSALTADASIWERCLMLCRNAASAGGFLLLLPGLIVLVEYVAPRIWCRALCPLGALYSLIGRFAPFRVRVNIVEAGRSLCGRCTAHCPMGIDVMKEYTEPRKRSVDHPDCSRCGECVDVCHRKVLRLGFVDRNEADRKAIKGAGR